MKGLADEEIKGGRGGSAVPHVVNDINRDERFCAIYLNRSSDLPHMFMFFGSEIYRDLPPDIQLAFGDIRIPSPPFELSGAFCFTFHQFQHAGFNHSNTSFVDWPCFR